jgi:MT0933-like antitoxin protein
LRASAPGSRVGRLDRGQATGPAGETQEDGVSDFGNLEKKAGDYVKEHPDQADKGVDQVEGFVEDKTDHQHDERIDRAVDAAGKHLGENRGQPGGQN